MGQFHYSYIICFDYSDDDYVDDYKMLICNDEHCDKVSGNSMGHSLCADHCPCLRDDFVFDPLRCTFCCDFLRSKFQGVTEALLLKSASAELERHISKLRRFCSGLEPRPTLKFSRFVNSLRLAARQNSLDLDFFRDMSVGETVKTGKYSDALSETQSTSLAHGSLTFRPSSGGKRSGKYRKSGKAKEDTEMALIKGQMASMQEAIEKLSALPALFASISATSERKDSGEPETGSKSDRGELGQGSDTRPRRRPLDKNLDDEPDRQSKARRTDSDVGLSGQEGRSVSGDVSRDVPRSHPGSETGSVRRSESRLSSKPTSDSRTRPESRSETGDVSQGVSGSGRRSLHGRDTDDPGRVPGQGGETGTLSGNTEEGRRSRVSLGRSPVGVGRNRQDRKRARPDRSSSSEEDHGSRVGWKTARKASDSRQTRDTSGEGEVSQGQQELFDSNYRRLVELKELRQRHRAVEQERREKEAEQERREREARAELAREEERQRRRDEQVREEQRRREVEELARAEVARERENQRREEERVERERDRVEVARRERERLAEVARQTEHRRRVDEQEREAEPARRLVVEAKERERKRRLGVGVSNQVAFVLSTYFGLD